MKVIILGAGQVGASVAEGLVSEESDITIVDYDGQRLARLQGSRLAYVAGYAARPQCCARLRRPIPAILTFPRAGDYRLHPAPGQVSRSPESAQFRQRASRLGRGAGL